MNVRIEPTLIREWIALQYTDPNSGEYEKRIEAAFQPAWDMTREHPDEGWAFISGVIEVDSSDHILANLSAGPLEDLLVYQGTAVIDRIEDAAEANPKFAFLLGGVWRNTISQEVWDRVCAVRDCRGWDGWRQELREMSAGSYQVTLRDVNGSIRYSATGSDPEALGDEAKKWLSRSIEGPKSISS